jgi:hypothetical protein
MVSFALLVLAGLGTADGEFSITTEINVSSLPPDPDATLSDVSEAIPTENAISSLISDLASIETDPPFPPSELAATETSLPLEPTETPLSSQIPKPTAIASVASSPTVESPFASVSSTLIGPPPGTAVWEIVLVAVFVLLTIGLGCAFLACSRNRKKSVRPTMSPDENAGEPLLIPVEYF